MLTAALKLPPQVIGRHELMHVRRELDLLDEQFEQAKMRNEKSEAVLSNQLDALVSLNEIELTSTAARSQLLEEIEQLQHRAPTIHVSFASDPSPEFLTKLTAWFRSEVHPQVLIQVGMQPSIAAGCVLRTPNKYFDFSLRQHLEAKRQTLVKLLDEANE